MKEIKTIGVLTSGGDAPGMNACIRAVTRSAIFNGMKVMGIYRGYEGLIHGEFKELTTESVSNTIQRGGTLLKTARSKDFQTPEGRKQAYDNLEKAKYEIPDYWTIGEVYERLIEDVSEDSTEAIVDTIMAVYSSWISDAISNYNTDFYYQSREYICQCYTEGEVCA